MQCTCLHCIFHRITLHYTTYPYRPYISIHVFFMYTSHVSVHNHVTPKTADLLAQLGGWNQGSRTIFERALHLSLPAAVEFHHRTILVAQILIGHTPRNQCFIAIRKKQRETLKISPGTFAIPTISRTSLIN